MVALSASALSSRCILKITTLNIQPYCDNMNVHLAKGTTFIGVREYFMSVLIYMLVPDPYAGQTELWDFRVFRHDQNIPEYPKLEFLHGFNVDGGMRFLFRVKYD